MSVHTQLHVEAQGEAGYAILDHNDNFYARTYSSVDARLIAAAPRMRELLEAFTVDYAPNASELAKYRASARAILRDVEG